MKNLLLGILLAIAFDTALVANSTAPRDTIPAIMDDTVITDLNFDENLDSLLNLYYVGQSVASDPEFWNNEADSLIPDFSDSVYIERLKKIPTVVDLTYNSIVRRYIEVYTRQKRSSVGVMLGLSQYYFPLFDDIFDYYDVPNEMKYMSIIESALNPRATSRARAVGLWQFMYGTGRSYGLTINSLVDERRDPIKATYAAARYVKDLYSIYRDWTLVIAAYNCGPGNVNKAIRRSGGKRNYWDIYYYLPRETRGHVPAFIAATYVMYYYREHNLKPIPVNFPVTSDTIMITKNLHFMQISEMLGIPVPLLKDMNPQYRTDIIPVHDRPMSLRLPMDQVTRFIDMEKDIYAYKDSVYFNPEKNITSPTTYDARSGFDEPPPGNYSKLTYTVKEGDNLGFIAMWYNVRLSDIRYWNNIRQNTIRSGQKLSIYVPRNKVSKYEDINELSFAQKQARVGKTVTAETTQPAQPLAAGNGFVIYTVKQGDTIWDIIKKYPGVTETEVKQWNNLTDAAKIRAGQQLKIKPKS
ncbi:MAG: LysM peptidoglycan-binding domain-containing protein [Bacteroidales bacterium]